MPLGILTFGRTAEYHKGSALSARFFFRAVFVALYIEETKLFSNELLSRSAITRGYMFMENCWILTGFYRFFASLVHARLSINWIYACIVFSNHSL